jgi:adenylyltransferase/sulfurtransferase
MNPATTLLPDPAMTHEVTPQQVATWLMLPENERPRFIDCREPEELAICQLPGNEAVPLGTFPERVDSLTGDPARGVVIYCHHGMRSLRAAAFLRSKGYQPAFSMAGGIDAWSRGIDPSVPRY